MTTQHIDDKGQHIEELDRRLSELRGTLADLANFRDIDEILRLIHHPGFTSVVEFYFVNTLLGVVQSTALDLAHQRAALRDGVLHIAEETMS